MICVIRFFISVSSIEGPSTILDNPSYLREHFRLSRRVQRRE